MRKALLLTLLFLTTLLCRAQYVTIPDANFVKYLQSEFPAAMNGNQMDTTASVITSAKNVACIYRGITNIYGIQFFDSLVTFQCTDNNLSDLPTLPSNLVYLYCYNNRLTSLPQLPDNLLELNCYNNRLTYLPSLPDKLKNLITDSNQITSIPTLPNSLGFFSCNHNQLTSLPVLPNSIRHLDCANNQIKDLPTLPNSVRTLDCASNKLTKLPQLPDKFETLFCNSNKLTSLPAFPNTLTSLICTDNPGLTCLPHFTQNLFYFFEVKKNTQIRCLPRTVEVFMYLDTAIDSSAFLPLCRPYSGCPIAYGFSGNVHQYTSGNCSTDSLNNGPALSGIKLLQYTNGKLTGQGYTGKNGFFGFNASRGDSVEVKIDSALSTFVNCPSTGTRKALFTAQDTLFLNQDFGVNCNGTDVGVTSIYGAFRPTRSRPVYIQAGDMGHKFLLSCAKGVKGTVTTTIMGPASYVAPLTGALTPSSIQGKTLTYSISDFGSVNPDSAFNIIVNTDSSAKIGSEICIKTKVSASKQDVNTVNDSLLFCGRVVNSFDPNDKTAFPAKVVTPDTWITYTIRFQNTGTDTAYHIVVLDTLSDNLDESTFTYLDGSGEPVITLNGKAVMFNYPGINLLDSHRNEPKSHGWLQYKVKTVSNLRHFSQIHNTAHIYFDQNDPVVTNTTAHEYVTRSLQNITTCDSADIHGNLYYTNQIIVDTLRDDSLYSIITTNLVVNNSSSTSQKFTSCDSLTYRGLTYYSSQTISDTFSNSHGCDSTVTTNLIINSAESQTTLDGPTITCNQANAQYQWLDCDDNYSIIPFATNRSFTAVHNGNYAAEVVYKGCIDTSSCVNINGLTTRGTSAKNTCRIYPNPTRGTIVVDFEHTQSHIQAKITSVTGQVIASDMVSNTNRLLFNLESVKGIYFIEIITENGGRTVEKILLQEM